MPITKCINNLRHSDTVEKISAIRKNEYPYVGSMVDSQTHGIEGENTGTENIYCAAIFTGYSPKGKLLT